MRAQRLSLGLRLILVTLLFALLPAACSTETPSQTQPDPIDTTEPASGATDELIEIEYWQPNTGADIAAMDILIELFHEQHPHIRVIHNHETPLEDYFDAMDARIPAGLGPDIVLIAHTRQAAWIDAGYLAPLPETHFPHADVRATYSPVIEAGFFNDTLYSLPTTVRTAALFYNKDLLEEVGLDPNQPPTTLEELEAQAAQCTQRNEDGTYEVMGLPISVDGQAGYWFREVLLRQFGQEPYSEDGRRVTWNDSPNGYAAWAQILRFQGELETGDASLFEGEAYYFLVGRACFHVDTLFRLETLASNAPDLRFGTVELPTHNDIRLTFGSYWAHSITQKGASSPERLDASAQFLKYITGYAAARLWADIAGDLPAHLEAMDDTVLRNDPTLGAFVSGLAYARPVYYVDEAGERQALLDAYQAVIFESADAALALDGAVATIQAIFDAHWERR